MLIQEETQCNSNLGCEDRPSQPTRACLTKNSIAKNLWEKRSWRKEHAHDSSLYMFKLLRLLALSALRLIFPMSSSLDFGSLRCFYNMVHRLHPAHRSSPLGAPQCACLRLRGLCLWYCLSEQVFASKAFTGLHLQGIRLLYLLGA